MRREACHARRKGEGVFLVRLFIFTWGVICVMCDVMWCLGKLLPFLPFLPFPSSFSFFFGYVNDGKTRDGETVQLVRI